MLNEKGECFVTWDDHYATAAGLRHWPCEELVRATGSRRFVRVLEAGVGNGANIPFLLSRASEVVGIDDNVTALGLAATSSRNKVLHLQRANILEPLPFPAGHFDGLVDVMTSQHVPEHEHFRVYAEYRRVLRTGGWFFLYHLTGLSGKKELVAASHGHDYMNCEQFPTVDLISLPSAGLLALSLSNAGFKLLKAGSLERVTFGEPQTTARYSVIQAEAV